jgi:hypothetical protein
MNSSFREFFCVLCETFASSAYGCPYSVFYARSANTARLLSPGTVASTVSSRSIT